MTRDHQLMEMRSLVVDVIRMIGFPKLPSTQIDAGVGPIPMYTFSCFRVPKSICNKMDAISRAFWWGHDVHTRKMHLLNWDKVCKLRREGGLGLKKFSIMNRAMLAKQYWRISQNPQSLISKIFKAKYFPKPYHSWFWRGIITPKNKNL